MNLNLIFKAQGIVLIINGLGSLFFGSLWISQGTGWESTPDLITFGQFVGVVLLVNGIWSWRFPDIAAENIKSIGMLFALGGLLFTVIILFHIVFIVFFLAKSFSNSIFNINYLYVFFIVQIFRYKIIYDLGEFWTTKILVINKPLVKTRMFRYFRHPNYLVVFLEVILVCLFFNDFYSLIVFSVINSVLIATRIFFEEKANKFRLML